MVVISGCSGGGKSSLLRELARRGFRTVDEPGRRVLRSQAETGGNALPWVDPVRFATLCFALSVADHAKAEASGELTFFDRSFVDAYSALETHAPTVARRFEREVSTLRFSRTVFLAPPWRSIHVTDSERRHSFDDAVAEYRQLAIRYPAFGYVPVEIPRIGVEERADFVVDRLRAAPPARTIRSLR